VTAQNRATLKLLFEDGDKPDGSNYADWIDSMVSIADTTAQTISSDFTAPKLIATTEVSSPLVVTTEVSASVGNFAVLTADTLSAQSIVTSAMSGVNAVYTGTVSASAVNADIFLGISGTYTGTVSASAVQMGILKLDVPTTSEATTGAGGAVPASASTFAEITVGGTAYRIALFDA